MAFTEGVDGEADDGEIDHDIGPVEDWELNRNQFQEIGDRAQSPTIKAIPNGSSEQKSQSQPHPEPPFGLKPDPSCDRKRDQQAENTEPER